MRFPKIQKVWPTLPEIVETKLRRWHQKHPKHIHLYGMKKSEERIEAVQVYFRFTYQDRIITVHGDTTYDAIYRYYHAMLKEYKTGKEYLEFRRTQTQLKLVLKSDPNMKYCSFYTKLRAVDKKKKKQKQKQILVAYD